MQGGRNEGPSEEPFVRRQIIGSLIAEGYVYADDAADLDDGADIRIRLGFLQTLMLATRSKVAA
jgi:hypothetical protein